MKRNLLITSLLVVVALQAGGCVSQKQSDQLQELYRRSQEQVIELRARLAQCEAQMKAMQNLPPQVQQDPALLSRLAALTAERDQLAAALKEAQDALVRASQQTILPAELDQDLLELAEMNKALMQYDPKAGKLKLESDLTFALGSTDVSAGAKASLQKLAQIMAKPVASRFALQIVGHTDNVRIARAETKAKHPTNWHLSVHRSIAVKDVLEQAGVNPQRLMVAGHGEFQPVVPNGAKGAQANRRVEIIVVPNTYAGPGLSAAESSAASTADRSVETTAPAAAPAAKPMDDFFK